MLSMHLSGVSQPAAVLPAVQPGDRRDVTGNGFSPVQTCYHQTNCQDMTRQYFIKTRISQFPYNLFFFLNVHNVHTLH